MKSIESLRLLTIMEKISEVINHHGNGRLTSDEALRIIKEFLLYEVLPKYEINKKPKEL